VLKTEGAFLLDWKIKLKYFINKNFKLDYFKKNEVSML